MGNTVDGGVNVRSEKRVVTVDIHSRGTRPLSTKEAKLFEIELKKLGAKYGLKAKIVIHEPPGRKPAKKK